MSFGRCVLLAFVAAIAVNLSGQEPTGTSFLVTNVRVFDGERVHQKAQVAVEGGVIRAVGPDLTRTAWRRLLVVDGGGGTLLPGLIDAHAHVRSMDDLADAARFGVTTVLDMGAAIPVDALTKLRATVAGRADVADLRTAGLAALAPGGGGSELRPEGEDRPTVAAADVADGFVAARKAEGSDYLKILINGIRAERGAGNLDRPRVKALVAAAHARGMRAVSHVETTQDVDIAIDSGADGLAHAWRRGGHQFALARRVAARNVFVIATLAVPDAFLTDSRTALLQDSRLRPFLPPRVVGQLQRSFDTASAPERDAVTRRQELDAQIGAARSLHEAGVRLLVGTDALADGPSQPSRLPVVHGVSVHRELELYTRAGLTALEALSAATANTADAFGLTDRGRIVEGRRADLVLLRGNPIADITATRDIVRVWRDGAEVMRAVAVQ